MASHRSTPQRQRAARPRKGASFVEPTRLAEQAVPSRAWRLAMVVAVVAFGAAFGVYRQSPSDAGGLGAFTSPYVCNDDARQQVYWMARFHEPALFQDDVVVEYAAQYVTPLVKGIFWVLTFIWPPILAGKIIAVALMALGAYWCYRIGEKLSGWPAGLACAILFAASPAIADRVAGGNPRAFMYPLLAAWLCYLVRQEHWKVAAIAVVSALAYPMTFMLCAPVWLLDAVRFGRSAAADQTSPVGRGARETPIPNVAKPKRGVWLDRSRARWLPTAVGLLLGAAGLGSKYLVVDPRFGAVANRERVLKDPAFRDGGRFHEVVGNGRESTWNDMVLSAGAPLGLWGRWDGRSWMSRNPGWALAALGAIIVGWLILAALRLVPLPRQFVYLALASVAMYGVAWLVVFKLFVPTRYLQFSLPLLVLLGIGLVLTAPLSRLRSAPRWLGPGIGLLVVGSVAFLLDAVRLQVPQVRQQKAARLWQKIEAVVPPDSVVAGPPETLDSLGVFSRRKAYMPGELAHPAYIAYYDQIVLPRLTKTLDVLFAERPEDVMQFAAQEKVDYLFFEPGAIRAGSVKIDRPLDDHLRSLLRNERPRCLLKLDPRHNLLRDIARNVWLIRISPGPENAFGVTQ